MIIRKSIYGLPVATAWLLCAVTALAQSADPQQQEGKVYQERNMGANFNQGNYPAATVALIKSALEKVKAIIGQDPVLRPPVGFDAVYNQFDGHITKEIPWQKPLPFFVDYGLPQYYTDRNNTIQLGSEATADLSVEINSFRHLYYDTYSHDLDAAGYPCPIFFFRYTNKQADSTREYVEYSSLDGSQPIRAVTNGRALFAPLSQEQYLNFQIQLNKKTADDNMKTYVHDSLTVANIPAKGEILKADRDLVTTWRDRMTRHRQQLAALDAGQRKQPAYIVFGGAANGPVENMEELTTSDDPKGQELWTINPDYFNKNLPLTAVQLIVVRPEYAHIATLFIKAKVMELYRQVDFKALKALIQN